TGQPPEKPACRPCHQPANWIVSYAPTTPYFHAEQNSRPIPHSVEMKSAAHYQKKLIVFLKNTRLPALLLLGMKTPPPPTGPRSGGKLLILAGMLVPGFLT